MMSIFMSLLLCLFVNVVQEEFHPVHTNVGDHTELPAAKSANIDATNNPGSDEVKICTDKRKFALFHL